eukprot:gene9255-18391_t
MGKTYCHHHLMFVYEHGTATQPTMAQPSNRPTKRAMMMDSDEED